MVGSIVSISDLNVKILLNNPEEILIGDLLETNYSNKLELAKFETEQNIKNNHTKSSTLKKKNTTN